MAVILPARGRRETGRGTPRKGATFPSGGNGRRVAAMSTDIRTLPLASGLWTLDTLHSQVSFTIRHLGVSKVRGRFNAFDAALDVGAGIDDTKVTAVIDVASLDTGNKDRDAHVLSPDFLHAEQHPEIRFASTRIAGADDDWVLAGDVTINGVTRDFEFPVEFGGIGDFNGEQHAGFSAAGDLRRSDFGLDFGTVAEAGLGKVVRFEIDLQFAQSTAVD
jgi:polyisoprenoid-binding protein YceI